LQLYVNDKYGLGFTDEEIYAYFDARSVVEGDDGLIAFLCSLMMEYVLKESKAVTGFNLKSEGSYSGLNGLSMCKMQFF